MQPRLLNNSGTRMVTDEKILVTGIYNGKTYHKMRKPMFWETFGNFSRCYVRVGKSVYRGELSYNDNGILVFDIMKCYRLR